MTGLVRVDTRPSMLYATLFSALGDKAEIFLDVLVGIAIFFGVIELIALFIGMRLSRSITKSVAELYVATQHVNRGDLAYRIKVRTDDQMAALEQSFNSMTQSLSNLMSEQKEKQRLESELAIAHEVQDLLFPADLSGLTTLEVHGVCRPGADRERRLLRFHSVARRQAGPGGRRHQRQRYFGGAVDGHGARVRTRLFAGAGANPGVRGVGCRPAQEQRSPYVLSRRWH